MILVSIIVPIYNSKDTLKACVNSVLRQTFSNLEIILVDDGSKDNSLELCKDFEKQDRRVKVITKENSGPADTRNIGLKYAHGKYVSFVDSDDLLLPDFVQVMVREAEKTNCDMVVCGRFFFHSTNRICIDREILYSKQEIMLTDRVEKIFAYSGTTGPMCKLYKKSILDKYGIMFPSKLKMFEDGIFNAMYLQNCKSALLLSDQLYCHRLSCTSLSKKTNHSNLINIINDLWDAIKPIDSQFVRDYFITGMLKTIILKIFNANYMGSKFDCYERREVLSELFSNELIQNYVSQKDNSICVALSKRSYIRLWIYAQKIKIKNILVKMHNTKRLHNFKYNNIANEIQEICDI